MVLCFFPGGGWSGGGKWYGFTSPPPTTSTLLFLICHASRSDPPPWISGNAFDICLLGWPQKAESRKEIRETPSWHIILGRDLKKKKETSPKASRTLLVRFFSIFKPEPSSFMPVYQLASDVFLPSKLSLNLCHE